MSTDTNSLAADLERQRAQLARLARLQVAPRWRDKIDLSGVVQMTMVEAWRAGLLRRCSAAERAAWLHKALRHNLVDALRKLSTAKRNVGRERGLADLSPALQASPSQQVAQLDLAARLPRALTFLPENQRRAVELHYLQGRSLAEVAVALETTKPAATGLVHRGLVRLRELFAVLEK